MCQPAVDAHIRGRTKTYVSGYVSKVCVDAQQRSVSACGLLDAVLKVLRMLCIVYFIYSN